VNAKYDRQYPEIMTAGANVAAKARVGWNEDDSEGRAKPLGWDGRLLLAWNCTRNILSSNACHPRYFILSLSMMTLVNINAGGSGRPSETSSIFHAANPI
jgi:hypothetical protein